MCSMHTYCLAKPKPGSTIHIIRQALPDESFITSSHSSGLHRHDLLSHSLMPWIPSTAMIQVYRNNFKRPINFHRIWSIAQCGSRNITLSISAWVHRDRHDLLIAFKWIAKLMTVLAMSRSLSPARGPFAWRNPSHSSGLFTFDFRTGARFSTFDFRTYIKIADAMFSKLMMGDSE